MLERAVLPRERRPQLGVDRPADPRDDLRQRLYVRLVGVEIDDAGAQQEAAADHRVGDEGLAAPLKPAEELAVERVEMGLDGGRTGIDAVPSPARSAAF